MTTTNTRYIFDTCLLIYLSRADEPIAPPAREVLETTAGAFHVSAISVWEIGLLVSKGRLNLTRAPLEWFRSFVGEQDLHVLNVTPEILVASSFLPGPLHGDPADRILIATAREHDLTIITRDRAILAYGAAGHVRTLAC
jgi:PIN domain nuclease of toxin-antitoxin system